ncbi:substrate-binding domain-containing protein [Herbivorax sp. ANBcel31]|uniref:substrate-binding domain-containing protein n=1 Tax=Herbivorax sp. ANBcel31 TaxID=3069754 RepID=UPI0027B506DB|nr:substrate-binding domain-containing protein [Herbivorax sp. ANBcel31]MDQ2086582.1 substrate-binding domain-containing protein [Herbivorax sp. ANBcel31]
MKKRKTIGIMINSLDGSFSSNFWLMIKKAVEKNDCNLIIYEGRGLNYASDLTKKHTIVYGFIDKRRIEGLILTSTVADYMSYEEVDKLLQRFEGIPMVSIGQIIARGTSILVDNKMGMKSQIRHLINDHEYRKIAFVKGPRGNYEAIERYQAYLEVLEENSIRVDENIIFEGDFSSQEGYKIMKEIIAKGIEYDAIVFSNDDMALAALKAIEEVSKNQEIDVSKRKVICGFDDSTNAKLAKPSLTTVRQPIEEICDNAVKILLEKIDGKEKEKIVKHPAVLVKRESCGCKHEITSCERVNKNIELVPNVGIHVMLQTFSLDKLYDNITEVSKKCNIRSCFVSTYFEGTIIYKSTALLDKSFSIPEKSQLVYAFYNNERIKIEEDKKYFNTKDIVPDCFLPEDRRFIYLVNPLFFDEDQFGFVCFEIVNEDVANLEGLRGEISNTLKGALTMLERDKMEKILLESERLASLGQLMGGISHNLMSPIMSISGIQAAMDEMIDEYSESITDPEVTVEDHIEISKEMRMWNDKLKEYNSYMSKVISKVKSQTVLLNSNITSEFTIEEVLDRIKIIKNNNTTIKNCNLNIETDINIKTKISGDISNLMQIVENLILNAIDAYDEKEDAPIDINIYSDGNSVIFKIRDYGEGISEGYKDKIFKSMVTSKGKKGVGLSLLLSYSTIKGRFGGEMWFEDPEGKGSIFYMSIPVRKSA